MGVKDLVVKENISAFPVMLQINFEIFNFDSVVNV